MPWHIGRSDECPASKPHAVIKDSDGSVAGCHSSEADARRQMNALYANEPAMKAVFDMKAELMTDRQLNRWLSGDIPRRILAVPFYGPIPGADGKGRDIDGEYFDETTDIYGPHPALKATRERLVDWHHDDAGVPTGNQWMKGSILGRIVLDEGPSEFATDGDVYEGIAADWWARQGEKRLALVKALQARGAPIYGSSQAAYARKAADGHIELWPLIRHTISTSPQNTHAVVPPLKAVLTADASFDEVGLAALKAALVGLDSLISDLQPPSGMGAAVALKAGRVLSAANEAELRRALEALGAVLGKLPSLVTDPYAREPTEE